MHCLSSTSQLHQRWAGRSCHKMQRVYTNYSVWQGWRSRVYSLTVSRPWLFGSFIYLSVHTINISKRGWIKIRMRNTIFILTDLYLAYTAGLPPIYSTLIVLTLTLWINRVLKHWLEPEMKDQDTEWPSTSTAATHPWLTSNWLMSLYDTICTFSHMYVLCAVAYCGFVRYLITSCITCWWSCISFFIEWTHTCTDCFAFLSVRNRLKIVVMVIFLSHAISYS